MIPLTSNTLSKVVSQIIFGKATALSIGRSRPARIRRLALLLVLLASVSTARAAEIEGVYFHDQLEVAAQSFDLYTVGLLRYRVIFRGYVAALYLGDGVSEGSALADVPKRLELEYFWSIAGEQFGRAANRILARSLTPQAFEEIRPRIEALHAHYCDVEPGDRYALTYIPGRGTELSFNGASLIVIPGADFGRDYLGIWLGESPLDEGLRDVLLKR